MDVALQYALGNPVLEEHLAGLIVEQAVLESNAPKSLILALPVDGKAGRDALVRLAGNDRNRTAAQLARIALAEKRPLRTDLINEYLNSPDSDIRSLAATRFAHTLSQEQRISMTRDLSDTVRSAAVVSLCPLAEHPDITAALVERLTRDPVAHVRAAATRCPLHLGKDRSQRIRETIATDPNPGVRTAAIQGLVSLGDDSDMVWITRIISGPMTVDKVIGAVALSRRRHPDGFARLTDALESQNPAVLAKAASLADYAGLPNTESLLIPLLDHRDSSVAIAAATQLLLHHHHVSRATAVLEQHWKKGNESALQALVDANHPAAVAHVRLLLAPDAISLTVLERHQRNPVFRTEFVNLLSHADRSIRLGASIAVLQAARTDR
jgi:HEAT repeat protein